MPIQYPVTFKGSSGQTLAARLDIPVEQTVKAYALFAHCFTCSKDIFGAKYISAALAKNGFAVLRFDFTGLGHSEGEFANTNFTTNMEDILAAVKFLRQEKEPPQLMIGHSLGGAAVLACTHKIPELKAVATVGAPFDPSHVAHLFASSNEEIESKGEAEVKIAGRPFHIKKQLLDDISSHNMAESISQIKIPLLVCHSPSDQIVNIDNAAEIFTAAKHPKSFLSLDTADHLLTKSEDADYVAGVVAAWAHRYAGKKENEVFEGAQVLVAENGIGRFSQTILTGRHIFAADEPIDRGGDDTGPGPYEFLQSGLGSCTSMTIRLYAQRKKWPLEHVGVFLNHEKINGQDHMTRTVVLEGDLDDDQRQRLLEIANKCPTHNTLEKGVRIETVLQEIT